MVKVVHIIIGLNVGGAELMLKRLILNGSEEFEHEVISLTDVGEIGEQLREKGVRVHTLGIKKGIGAPFVIFRLKKLIKILRPNVVHTWMYHADFFGGVAARLAGCRNVVWCVRSTNIEKGGSRFTLILRRFCALLSYFIPKKIIYAAKASRYVHEMLGYSKLKGVVIPNGFDTELFNPEYKDKRVVRDELGLPKDGVLIGSVGRFHPVKDHETFLSAAAIIQSEISNVGFVLIGRGLEDGNSKLNEMIKKYNVRDCFLLGEKKNIPDCMSALDIFCLHSISEGFPNVLGEAMASGLPCITTDVGDGPYMLQSGDFVSVPQDPKELAEKLCRLIEKGYYEMQLVGMVNRKIVENQFSLSLSVAKFESLYCGL